MSKTAKGLILIFITAFIWGSCFVAQSSGMQYIGPFTFTCVRSLVAAVVLSPLAYVFNKIESLRGSSTPRAIRGGIVCGLLLGLASSIQQIGIKHTTVGKAGFISTLYIVLVPVIGVILYKKRLKLQVWVAVAVSVVGLYLLCMKENFSLQKGDLWVALSALLFSLHILAVDRHAYDVNCALLSVVQLFTAGFTSGILMLTFETPDVSSILSCKWELLYAAVLSSGVAFTLQIIGQQYVNPNLSSLAMSFESVFAALSGWIILGQGMSAIEIVGAVLMFIAVVTAQFDFSVFSSKNKKTG